MNFIIRILLLSLIVMFLSACGGDGSGSGKSGGSQQNTFNDESLVIGSYIAGCVYSQYSESQPIEDIIELDCRDISFDGLEGIQYLTSLEVLKFNVSDTYGMYQTDLDVLAQSQALKELYINNDYNYRNLDFSVLKSMTTLEHFTFIDDESTDLSFLKEFTHIKHLILNIPYDYELESGLKQYFDVALASNDLEFVEQMTWLEGLVLPVNSDAIPDLSALVNLKTLVLAVSSTVSDLSSLSALTNLEILDIHVFQHDWGLFDAIAVSNTDFLDSLVNLEILSLQGLLVHDFNFVEAMHNLSAFSYDIDWCSSAVCDVDISDLSAFNELTNLEYFKLKYNSRPSLAVDLSELPLAKLRYLYLSSMLITDISDLNGMSELSVLHADLVSLDATTLTVPLLPKLVEFHWNSNQINSLNIVSDMPLLEAIEVKNLFYLTDFNISGCLPSLNSMLIESTELVYSEIEGFLGVSGRCSEHLQNLSWLELSDNPSLTRIGDVSHLTTLKHLDLSDNDIQFGLFGLSSLVNLETLNLRLNDGINDVKFSFNILESMNDLARLDLVGTSIPCSQIETWANSESGSGIWVVDSC